MTKVAHHIIEGYLIHRALVENEARKQDRGDAHTDKRLSYQELEYPTDSQTRPLSPYPPSILMNLSSGKAMR